jgi:asparagine synthase (glutamine-hydrolysing)
MPFSSPLRSWVKTGLKDMIDAYLSFDRLKKQGLFRPEGIRDIIDEDRHGISDNAHTIYGLLALQIWLETFGMA